MDFIGITLNLLRPSPETTRFRFDGDVIRNPSLESPVGVINTTLPSRSGSVGGAHNIILDPEGDVDCDENIELGMFKVFEYSLADST